MLAQSACLTALALAFTPHGAKPAAADRAPAAVVAVVDVQATLGPGAASDAWLALLRETLAEVGTEQPASDRTVIEHLLQPGKDAAGVPCRPLAHAIEEAARTLAARRERAKVLVIVTGGPDTCGGDACAAAARVVAAGGVRPRVVVVSSNAAADEALRCVGATAWAPGRASLREALADAVADAGATTGISVIDRDGAGQARRVRFALTPVETHPRTHLVSTAGAAADVYALAHGTYRLAVEGDPSEPLLVRVTEGQVTTVRTGAGSLVVRLANYWGKSLEADVEVWRRGEVAVVRTQTAATPGSAAPAASGPGPRRRIPHTTMPVNPPRDAEAPAPQAPTGTAPAAPRAAPAPESPAPPAPLARGRTGEALDLPTGTYDVVTVRGGVVHRIVDVAIEAGRRTDRSVRLGALKVTGGSAAVVDRAGNLRAVAAGGVSLDLAAGSYTLRSRDGSRTLAAEVEVRAGDLTLVEIP